MAFDSKQLRTCKQLLKIAKPVKGLPTVSGPTDDIFVRFGRFYAANGYSLASVEWDEYQHAGDDEWCYLSRFSDNDGKLIRFEFRPCERQLAGDFFSKHFIRHVDYTDILPVNPKLLASVLKLFEINDLKPIMEFDGARWELSAHNRDVSIKAIVMGVRQ